MLSNRLLQPVIDDKKIIIVIFSNRKQKSNLKCGICCKKYCKCCTSKQKIRTTIKVELANFN